VSSRPEPAPAVELLDPAARRFEAAVLEAEAADAPDVRALVEELTALGFHVLEPGADVEHLGLRPGDVLDLRNGRAAEALADQLERRRTGELPRVEPEPGWSVEIRGAADEPVPSTVLTLPGGRIGSRGVPLGGSVEPLVLASGIYDGEGPEQRLLECPAWNVLPAAAAEGDLRRVLDLRTGLELHEAGAARAVMFSSLARPGTAALVATGVAAAEGDPVTTAAADAGGVVMAVRDRPTSSGGLERIASYVADAERVPTAEEARASLGGVELEPLLAEHRAAWAARWAAAEVGIEGHDDLERAARYAVFHLQAAGPSDGESAVGARGLAGDGYKGHVFWDTDVFVLPHLAATHPAAARAMLEYRLRRLDAARAHARASGREGARFPWESARTGEDVTPPFGTLPNGQRMPILTGLQEEHVTSDVAWAAAFYSDWTGDRAFADGPGRTLLVETARYWASRLELDPDGSAHIRHVIGPDEYHEDVDDNAFTNVMARWNLRRAAAEPGVADDERRRWLELADAIVDGYDSATGLYEQFAGFFGLEPLIAAEIAPRRPYPGEVLLPIERLHASQVVKQTDVLMLHHLVPEEVAPGSLEPNLAFYEPRTTHGSSLSPAIHASLFARVGRFDDALSYLRMSALLDLDNITGSTRSGLHLATMGGVWQALAFGFAGLRAVGPALTLDPRVPPALDALEVRVRFRGTPLVVRASADELELRADGRLAVSVPGAGQVEVDGSRRFHRDDDGWRTA